MPTPPLAAAATAAPNIRAPDDAATFAGAPSAVSGC